MASNNALIDCEVILGNSNKRFSGVTSTMLQTLEYQKNDMHICVLGKHHLPSQLSHLAISFKDASRSLKSPLPDGRWRVFHARRNDEMIQALILKWLFSAKIKIVFTSTAQRQHSSFTRWLMRRMDGILSTCQAAANYLTTPPDRIIPHGIDTELYHPATETTAEALKKPSENHGDQERLQVGMFGRVREQKGSHLFVNACIQVFPKYPNAHAFLVGAITQDNASWVEGLKTAITAAGLSDKIKLLGEQPFEHIPELFRQADIVAALSRTEGFGLTVLEAMSSGAAVLATEAGAWPEIIEQGTHGWVVPINNQKEINNKLEALVRSLDNTRKMGAAGRKHVLQHYKIQDEARKLCEYYRAIANK